MATTIPIRMTSLPQRFSFLSSASSSSSSSSLRRTSVLLTASLSSGSNGSEAECPVPHEQQPINEFHSLSNSFPFSWASASPVEYASRLFVSGAAVSLLLGLPVAWFGSATATATAHSQPLKPLLSAASTGIFAVTLAVVRMYLGWAYVGNRLLSATVEYEETGWYDGQIWVKTAEVLARDRLLGSFSQPLPKLLHQSTK